MGAWLKRESSAPQILCKWWHRRLLTRKPLSTGPWWLQSKSPMNCRLVSMEKPPTWPLKRKLSTTVSTQWAMTPTLTRIEHSKKSPFQKKVPLKRMRIATQRKNLRLTNHRISLPIAESRTTLTSLTQLNLQLQKKTKTSRKITWVLLNALLSQRSRA